VFLSLSVSAFAWSNSLRLGRSRCSQAPYRPVFTSVIVTVYLYTNHMKARIHVLKARMKVGMMIANEIDTSPVSFLQFGTIHVIELLTHVP
jgi:hypothetical protein